MFEKVNPKHPDKVADTIAGAIVDLAYKHLYSSKPIVACEVLIGHGQANVIIESNYNYTQEEIESIVHRILLDKSIKVNLICVKQDIHLSNNQSKEYRCGDNGIFKGVPTTKEQLDLIKVAKLIYNAYHYDGKYIIANNRLIICQSNAKSSDIKNMLGSNVIVNPLGDWTGGINVDSGATNRKLGSDMGDAVTGGGLHGKDVSKADVSVNIYCYLLAQTYQKEIYSYCAIGDTHLNFYDKQGNIVRENIPYGKIIETAINFIDSKGGFEEFAKWGLLA